MEDEFDVSESQSQQPSFDIKAFLFRVLSYWKLFILFIGIGVFIVYQQNIRKQQSYRLGTQISIEEESNPLFTSTTSLTFNWGGVSGKVQTMITSLRSRTIHEKVVENLEYYITYLKQTRFRKDDIYTDAPFRIDLTPDSYQLLNVPIRITFLQDGKYELFINFETALARTQNFSNHKKENLDVPLGEFKQVFSLGDTIDLPNVKGIVYLVEGRTVTPNEEYSFQFNDFDAVVAKYRNKLSVDNPRNSAILNLTMVDVNKPKIVDYLNETVKVLSEDQLKRKN